MSPADPAPAGSIASLQLCPGHRKPMHPVESAEAVENLGLRGDVHAIADSTRQVLLIERETLEELRLAPGDVKENITTTGIRLASLAPTSRLRIGSHAVLEITKPCSPCSRMNELRPGLQSEIGGRRGMLARVIAAGTVRRGDPVTVVPP